MRALGDGHKVSESFYELRLTNAQNDRMMNRKRYENGERELADLSGKQKKFEVFASDTRSTIPKTTQGVFVGVRPWLTTTKGRILLILYKSISLS